MALSLVLSAALAAKKDAREWIDAWRRGDAVTSKTSEGKTSNVAEGKRSEGKSSNGAEGKNSNGAGMFGGFGGFKLPWQQNGT